MLAGFVVNEISKKLAFQSTPSYTFLRDDRIKSENNKLIACIKITK
jgi:ribosome-binding factor A